MIRKRDVATVVGVGAACVACCTAPVAGLVAAIGIGTLGGVLLLGGSGLVLAAAATVFVMVVRRRRRRASFYPQRNPSAGKCPTGSTR